MSATIMISGHLDLTQEEFDKHYKPQIDYLISEGIGDFLVGDARGCDTMAQEYLYEKKVYLVTVFHMMEEPRNNKYGFDTDGGYKSDEERDDAMIFCANDIVAWSRRKGSGTERNIKKMEK